MAATTPDTLLHSLETSIAEGSPAQFKIAVDNVMCADEVTKIRLSAILCGNEMVMAHLEDLFLACRPAEEASIYVWLFDWFKSNHPILQRFVVRFIPSMVFSFLTQRHVLQSHDPHLSVCLVGLFNSSPLANNVQMPKQTESSIYHTSVARPLESFVLTPPPVLSRDDSVLGQTNMNKPEDFTLERHLQIKQLNDTNANDVIATVLNRFVIAISEMPPDSMKMFCKLCASIVGQGYDIHLSDESGRPQFKPVIKTKKSRMKIAKQRFRERAVKGLQKGSRVVNMMGNMMTHAKDKDQDEMTLGAAFSNISFSSQPPPTPTNSQNQNTNPNNNNNTNTSNTTTTATNTANSNANTNVGGGNTVGNSGNENIVQHRSFLQPVAEDSSSLRNSADGDDAGEANSRDQKEKDRKIAGGRQLMEIVGKKMSSTQLPARMKMGQLWSVVENLRNVTNTTPQTVPQKEKDHGSDSSEASSSSDNSDTEDRTKEQTKPVESARSAMESVRRIDLSDEVLLVMVRGLLLCLHTNDVHHDAFQGIRYIHARALVELRERVLLCTTSALELVKTSADYMHEPLVDDNEVVL